MELNKLTRKSQEALTQAQAIASEYGHQQIYTEHVLSALLRDDKGLIVQLINRMGLNTQEILNKVNEVLGKLPRVLSGGTEQG